MAEEKDNPRAVDTILKLKLPLIVKLGGRKMSMDEILQFAPGRIVELPLHFNTQLEVKINNHTIGEGEAVKIGEYFGIRVTKIVDKAERIKAMSKE